MYHSANAAKQLFLLSSATVGRRLASKRITLAQQATMNFFVNNK